MAPSTLVLADYDRSSCLIVNPGTRAELPKLARGRILLIDYFARVGQRGVILGDVELRWLTRAEDLPAPVLRVTDLPESPVFIVPELAPLMVRVHARLEAVGPHWPPFLRHLAIRISDGEAWLDFFAARASPLGRHR
jgi:hypothetical protein